MKEYHNRKSSQAKKNLTCYYCASRGFDTRDLGVQINFKGRKKAQEKSVDCLTLCEFAILIFQKKPCKVCTLHGKNSFVDPCTYTNSTGFMKCFPKSAIIATTPYKTQENLKPSKPPTLTPILIPIIILVPTITVIPIIILVLTNKATTLVLTNRVIQAIILVLTTNLKAHVKSKVIQSKAHVKSKVIQSKVIL